MRKMTPKEKRSRQLGFPSKNYEVIMIREQRKVSVFDSDAADIDFAEFKERVSSMSRHPKLKADLEAFKRKYPYFWVKYQQESKKKR